MRASTHVAPVLRSLEGQNTNMAGNDAAGLVLRVAKNLRAWGGQGVRCCGMRLEITDPLGRVSEKYLRNNLKGTSGFSPPT